MSEMVEFTVSLFHHNFQLIDVDKSVYYNNTLFSFEWDIPR